MNKRKCVWVQAAIGHIDKFYESDRVYQTSCDHAYYFTEGGPVENAMKYCCYCGKELEESNE